MAAYSTQIALAILVMFGLYLVTQLTRNLAFIPTIG